MHTHKIVRKNLQSRSRVLCTWLGEMPAMAAAAAAPLDAGSVDNFLLSPAACLWVSGAWWPWLSSSCSWYSSLMTFLM